MLKVVGIPVMERASDHSAEPQAGDEPRHPIIELNRKMETNRMNNFFYSQVSCSTNEYVPEGGDLESLHDSFQSRFRKLDALGRELS